MTDQAIIDELLAGRRYAPLGDLSQRNVVIYGAGGKARSLAHRLRGASRVVAFIDRNAKALRSGGALYGAPVITPEEWDERPMPNDALLLGTHNFATDMAPIYDWAAPRFGAIVSIADLMDILPGWEGPHYWAAPRAFLERQRESLARALSRFDEPQSRQAFTEALKERLWGPEAPRSRPTMDDQYAPMSLPPLGEPLRVIDCGAFNGDSLLKIARRESIEAIAAFEPDPDQQSALRRASESLAPNPLIFQAGAWSRDCSLRFEPIGPGSGSFIEFGSPEERTCPAFAIDSLIERGEIPFAPNFIKMDIEGAELAALLGAERAIRAHRPALALSAYHHPQDLWALSDWIAGLDLGYRFYLRSHGHNGFDLVLYARPSPSI